MAYIDWYAVFEDVAAYFIGVVFGADIKFAEHSADLEVWGHELVVNIFYVFYYSFVLIVVGFAVGEYWQLAYPVTW